jgi:hypothetical protein
MLPADPLDPFDALHDHEHHTWRCLICGEIIDRVIMQNRLYPRSQRGARRGSTPRQTVFKDPELG